MIKIPINKPKRLLRKNSSNPKPETNQTLVQTSSSSVFMEVAGDSSDSENSEIVNNSKLGDKSTNYDFESSRVTRF